MKYILMVKILLHANVGISICNDASLKTDTCKVPEYSFGNADIIGKYVVQVIPIQYPTSTNDNLGLYMFPIIWINGYTQSSPNKNIHLL